MIAVILAGGLGTRLSEETSLKPKPMVTIGTMPILWHIMKIYSAYGVNEFVICLGYKGYFIKEFFANYFLHMSDVTFDFKENGMSVHQSNCEPWKVTLVDTGQETMTGGRIKRIASYVQDHPYFYLTYGDGVSDVNIKELTEYHKSHGKLATVTGVQPSGRFGALHFNDDNQVKLFDEKPAGDGGFINGGFFVLSPKVIDSISGDETVWEQDPLISLTKSGELMAYKHGGFWKAMDTLRDKKSLETLWADGNAPWRVWE
jgi:glucose-1-phosphate cytidylyltransferase